MERSIAGATVSDICTDCAAMARYCVHTMAGYGSALTVLRVYLLPFVDYPSALFCLLLFYSVTRCLSYSEYSNIPLHSILSLTTKISIPKTVSGVNPSTAPSPFRNHGRRMDERPLRMLQSRWRLSVPCVSKSFTAGSKWMELTRLVHSSGCEATWCPCLLYGKTKARLTDPTLEKYSTCNTNVRPRSLTPFHPNPPTRT